MSNNNGIHHVVSDIFKNGDKSLCGKIMYDFDMPVSITHARACIDSGTYLQPCKNCMKKAENLN